MFECVYFPLAFIGIIAIQNTTKLLRMNICQRPTVKSQRITGFALKSGDGEIMIWTFDGIKTPYVMFKIIKWCFIMIFAF